MSTLVIALPSPSRLIASQAEFAPGPASSDYDWVLSPDDLQVQSEGRCEANQLPAATRTVAVLPPSAVAWHQLPAAPKAPAAKLQAALGALLEEQLLEDGQDIHLALPPQWSAGQPVWLAVVSRAWLLAHLTQLEAGGRTVDRVVPGWLPEGEPAAWVQREEQSLVLAWRDAAGPLCLPLFSPLARSLAAQGADAGLSWSACPEGAAQAAALAGGNVEARDTAQHWLACARSPWNLRQFDLTPKRRGQRALREAWQSLRHSPEWQGVRWGLVVLVVLQLVGANLWAWLERNQLAEQQRAMTQQLQTSFPQVRAIYDPAAQMRKEVELLRANAGRPGPADLETLLSAANSAWPSGRPAASAMRFENGRLSLSSGAWSPTDLEAFAQRLSPLGLEVRSEGDGVVLQAAGNSQAAAR